MHHALLRRLGVDAETEWAVALADGRTGSMDVVAWAGPRSEAPLFYDVALDRHANYEHNSKHRHYQCSSADGQQGVVLPLVACDGDLWGLDELARVTALYVADRRRLGQHRYDVLRRVLAAEIARLVDEARLLREADPASPEPSLLE